MRNALRTRFQQLGFFAASSFAFLLAALAFSASELLDRMSPALDQELLVGLEMRVPGSDTGSFSRTGVSRQRRDELLGRLPEVVASSVSVQATSLSAPDLSLAVTVVELEPAMANRLSPGQSLACGDELVYTDQRTVARFTARSGARLDGRLVQLVPVDLPWMAFFASYPGEPLVLRCRAFDRQAAQWLLVSGAANVAAQLRAIAALPEFSGEQLFSQRLTIQPLRHALRSAALKRIGWVKPALATITIICLLIAASWAILGGLRARRGDTVRRALGASPHRMVRRAFVLTGGAVIAAAALGLLLHVTLIHIGVFGSGAASGPVPAGYPVLAASAALLACILRSVISLGAFREGGGVGQVGSNFSARLWPFLAVWAFGFFIGSFALVMTLALSTHSARQAELQLGFQAEGLFAIPVRFATPPNSAEQFLADVNRARAAISRVLPQARTAAACTPPWRFEGFGFLENDDGSTGLMMPVSDGFLGLVGADLRGGRDLVEGDMSSTQIAIAQTGSADELRLWKARHSVVGQVASLRVGTLDPKLRSVLFQPLAQHTCQDFDLAFRLPSVKASQLLQASQAVQLDLAGVAVGLAHPVQDVYRNAHGPVNRLRDLFAAAALVGFGLTLLLTAVVWSALLAAQRREIAIRAALGAAPARLVRHMLQTVLRWAAPVVLAVLLTNIAVQQILSAYIVNWQAFGSLPTLLACLVLLIPGVIGLGAVGLREFSRPGIQHHLSA